MTKNTRETNVLLTKIRSKRREIKDYISKSEPRYARFTSASIVCSALAAALTAGPGIGGDGFVSSVGNTVPFGIPVWQILCLAATILSVTAVVATGMLKSHDLTSRIASARSCDAKLEGLETMLELAQLDVEHATPLYTQCLTEIPHV